MSAEEKVFSIGDLRLIILSYAIKHPDELPPTFYIKLKLRCKKICKNIKKMGIFHINNLNENVEDPIPH